jgi:hypothetical protein
LPGGTRLESRGRALASAVMRLPSDASLLTFVALSFPEAHRLSDFPGLVQYHSQKTGASYIRGLRPRERVGTGYGPRRGTGPKRSK